MNPLALLPRGAASDSCPPIPAGPSDRSWDRMAFLRSRERSAEQEAVHAFLNECFEELLWRRC